MSAIPILLADEETEVVVSAWRLTSGSAREMILIFGAMGLVTILLVIWAIYFRKRRRHAHHHAHRHASEPTPSPEVAAAGSGAAPSQGRHRRRRSRRRHRPLNPTLAETGGLPPIRQESPPEPQP